MNNTSLSNNYFVVFRYIANDVPPVQRAYESDAGIDIASYEDVVIPPLERKIVRTGVILDLKATKKINGDENNPVIYFADLRPRSGNAVKYGITVLNTPGTIDEGYQGEIKVIVFNSDKNNAFEIKKGFKLAQLVIHRQQKFTILIEDNNTQMQVTERGDKGFGSSDINLLTL